MIDRLIPWQDTDEEKNSANISETNKLTPSLTQIHTRTRSVALTYSHTHSNSHVHECWLIDIKPNLTKKYYANLQHKSHRP